MIELNYPYLTYKATKINGKNCIFDPVRKKYVRLTPEEWVRQHVIQYLIQDLSYSKGLIKLESQLVYEGLEKRSDILVYQQLKPYLLVECKAPEVKIDLKVLEQALRYNQIIKAPFILLTNGLKNIVVETDWKTNSSKQLNYIPAPLEK